jgi:hypothetical protein
LPICQWKTANLLRLFPAANDRRRIPDHVFMSADWGRFAE